VRIRTIYNRKTSGGAAPIRNMERLLSPFMLFCAFAKLSKYSETGRVYLNMDLKLIIYRMCEQMCSIINAQIFNIQLLFLIIYHKVVRAPISPGMRIMATTFSARNPGGTVLSALMAMVCPAWNLLWYIRFTAACISFMVSVLPLMSIDLWPDVLQSPFVWPWVSLFVALGVTDLITLDWPAWIQSEKKQHINRISLMAPASVSGWD